MTTARGGVRDSRLSHTHECTVSSLIAEVEEGCDRNVFPIVVTMLLLFHMFSHKPLQSLPFELFNASECKSINSLIEIVKGRSYNYDNNMQYMIV